MADNDLYGCIEAGGTKFVLGLVRGNRSILARTRLPTEQPAKTIPSAIAWMEDAAEAHGAIRAIGIASFGPAGLDRDRADWGHILKTTKPGWSNADMAGPFATAFGCPIGFDTDVNGAALAESLWGAAHGADVSVYITVGTGIGGGLVVRGAPVHGLSHPEMGHIRPPRHPDDREFAGVCPFHGDCLEGLASGPAVIARWGGSLSDLPGDHAAHNIIAFYLGQLTTSLSALAAPRRIVLGGGVLGSAGLIDRIRAWHERLAGDYLVGDPRTLIVPPALGDDAGLLGALAVAQVLRE
jgi:fructokinase